MVPSAFVTLEALPLTPGGKVNRRALPVPDRVRPELEGAFVAPRTPAEEVLAGICWAQVLGVERVDVTDNLTARAVSGSPAIPITTFPVPCASPVRSTWWR